MAEQLSWFDVASTQTLIDGSGPYRVGFGRQGLGAPPENFIEQDVPLSPGARLRQVKTSPNVVRVPVLIKASTESALMTAYRALRAAMNPLRGDGILQFVSADAITRQLNCRLYSGLEFDESNPNRGPGSVQAPLVFRAADPYWYDATTTSVVYTTFTTKTITNTGDVECWPKWTIHGPTTNITITNSTTNKSIIITLTLNGTDSLVIDTTPNVKTIVLNGTTNKFSTLDPTSALFPLALGTNSINFTVAGTSGATQVTVAYKQRYLGV